MIDDAEILNYIYESANMGTFGTHLVAEHITNEHFKNALHDQFTEYSRVKDESAALLKKLGHKPKEIGKLTKLSASMMTGMKTAGGSSPSGIAEMMIEGNTMGMVKSIKHLRDYRGENKRALALANKLLLTEQNNIEQMKKFL